MINIKAPLFIAVIPLFLASVTSHAQIIIKANDKSIRYDLIKPAHFFSRIFTFDTLGNLTDEAMSENIVKIDSAGETILFARSTQVPFGSHYSDSSIINHMGKPVSLNESTIPSTKHLAIKFNDSTVVAWLNRKGALSELKTGIAEGYFDDNIIEDIIGLITLKKGLKYHLDCYRYESNGQLNPYELKYVFDDYITGSTGKISDCMVLQFVNGFENGYIWIEKKSRITLKEVLQIGKFTYIVLRE